MQSDKLIGLPIIHIDLGKRCGVVQGLVLDPQARCVAGLVVTLPGWRQRGLLSIEYVYAIGEQAVTIVNDDAIKNASEESELRTIWQKGLDLKGMPVLTVTGRGLGSVESYEFQLDGAIEGIRVQRGSWGLKRNQSRIPGQMIRSFGEDAVIVAAEAEQAVHVAHTPEHSDARDDENNGQSDALAPTLADRWKHRVTSWGRRFDTTRTDESQVIMERDPESETTAGEIVKRDSAD